MKHLDGKAEELYHDLSRGGYSLEDLTRLLEGEIHIFEERHGFPLGYSAGHPSGPASPSLVNDGSVYPQLKGMVSLGFFAPITRQQLNEYNVPVTLQYVGFVEQNWRARFGCFPSDTGEGVPIIDCQFQAYHDLWVTGMGVYDSSRGRMTNNPLSFSRLERMYNGVLSGWDNLVAIGGVIIESVGPGNTLTL